jgi:hypothetical protein
METATIPDTDTLAAEFARILRDWLTPAELADVVDRNKNESNIDGVCHTHDFCDANIAMMEAWCNVTGLGEEKWDLDDEALCYAVNVAWAKAKASGFAI